jgi:hypothetical protein
MRILNIVSEVSARFTRLAYDQLLRHYFAYAPHDAYRNPRFGQRFLPPEVRGPSPFGGFLLPKHIR